MARLARAEWFDPTEVAVLPICAKVVRRCYLFGVDPFTGTNHDHRKIWIEDQLKLLATHLGIDLLTFAILSNHFHLILRSRPDEVGTWDASEVVGGRNLPTGRLLEFPEYTPMNNLYSTMLEHVGMENIVFGDGTGKVSLT